MGFTKGEGKFQKGQGGRPKGAKNKRTQEFKEALEKRHFCPANALIDCYEKAMADYEYYSELLRSNRISPMEDNSHKNLQIAASLAEKIASYTFPKLKSIEQIKDVNQDRPLKDLSDEELDKL